MKINLSRIKEIANRVLQETFESTTEESLYEEMKNVVEKYKYKVILDSLGVRRGWGGELELLQSGSFYKIMELLQKSNLEKISKELYSEIFKDVDFALSEKDKGHLRKEYKESYLNVLEDRIRELAEEQALADAESYFDQYLKSL